MSKKEENLLEEDLSIFEETSVEPEEFSFEDNNEDIDDFNFEIESSSEEENIFNTDPEDNNSETEELEKNEEEPEKEPEEEPEEILSDLNKFLETEDKETEILKEEDLENEEFTEPEPEEDIFGLNEEPEEELKNSIEENSEEDNENIFNEENSEEDLFSESEEEGDLFGSNEESEEELENSIEENFKEDRENSSDKDKKNIIKSFLSKFKKDKNNEEENIISETEQEELTEKIEDKNNEEEDSSNEQEDSKNNKLKSFFVLFAVCGLAYFMISGGNDNKKALSEKTIKKITKIKTEKNDLIKTEDNNKDNLTNPVKKPKMNFKINDKIQTEDSIKFNKKMNIKESIYDENVLEKITKLEKEVKSLKNTNKYNSSNNKDYIAKKFKMYKKLNKLLFKNQILLEDNSILSITNQNGQIDTIIKSEQTKNVLENTIPIPIESGAYMKNLENNIDYLILFNSNKFSESEIWKLSIITGLKKITNKAEKSLVLNTYKQNKRIPSDNLSIQDYTKSVLLINENAEIIDVLAYKDNSDRLNLEKIGSVIYSEPIIGYDTKIGYIFKENNGKIYKNGDLVPYDYSSDLYSFRLIKLENKETKNIDSYIVIYKGDNAVSKISLKDISHILFRTLTDSDGQKYIYSEGSIYKILGFNDRKKIGTGIILSSVKNGIILQKQLLLDKKKFKRIDLNKYIGKILISEENEFLIKRNTIEVKQLIKNKYIEPGLYPIEMFSLDNTFELKKQGKKIGYIKKIKEYNKVGVELTTPKHIIKIKSKKDYQVISLITGQDITEPGLKFSLDYNKKEIEVFKETNIEIDKKNKTINGEKYFTYEKKGKDYILYNENGTKTNIITEIKNEILFREKIKDLKIISGNVFDYFYTIETNTGEVKSSDLGSLAITYNKTNNPYPDFFDTTTKTMFKTEEIKNIRTDNIKISDLYNKNYFIHNLIFYTADSKPKKIIIEDTNLISVNGKKVRIKVGVYKVKRSAFELIFPKTLNKKDKRNLQSFGFSYPNTIIYIDKIEVKYKNYFDKKNQIYVINNGVGDIVRIGEKFYNIINKRVDLYDNKVVLTIKKNNKLKDIDLNMNFIDKIEDITAGQLLKLYNEQNKTEKEIKKKKTVFKYKNVEELKAQLKALEAQKQMIEKKTVQKIVLGMPQSEVKKLIKNAKVADFTLEIGSEIEYNVPERIELVKGMEGFTLGNVKTYLLRDRSGNEIKMKDGLVVLSVSGDFSKSKIYLKPTMLIFNMDGEKRKIEIPKEATVLRYKEDSNGKTYVTDGIPAYKIVAKLKNLSTMVMLETISGIIDTLTQPQDAMSQLLQGTNKTTDQNEKIQDSAISGAGSGLHELVDLMKAAAEEEKDVLITESNIDCSSRFINEIEVFWGNN